MFPASHSSGMANRASTGIRSIWLMGWGLLVAIGLLWMTAYAVSPGDTSEPLSGRPKGTSVPFSAEKPTLVMFLHPKCPCTQPSVAALGRLMARNHRMLVQPVFYLPGTKSKSWARDGYWDRTIEFGAHQPVIDEDGDIARKFNVTTSGHAILFSAAGNVLYSGGITSGRVHEGDNIGLTKLTRILDGVPVSDPTFPVFGCSIVKKQGHDHAH